MAKMSVKDNAAFIAIGILLHFLPFGEIYLCTLLKGLHK
jgi:hypothetical protein